jgi:hypothetical protein
MSSSPLKAPIHGAFVYLGYLPLSLSVCQYTPKSGGNNGGIDALIGAFDLDVLYEDSLFTPLLVPPAGFGPNLGDIFLGEAIGGIDTSAQGVVNLFEVSLLLDFELDALQGDSFTLATLGFYANGFPSGASTTFATDNIVLSDENGNAPGPVAHPPTSIAVPAPATLMLLAGGIAILGATRRRAG